MGTYTPSHVHVCMCMWACARRCERTGRFLLPLRCDEGWAPPFFNQSNPSTGVLGLAYLRAQNPTARFELLGWTFHTDLMQTFTTHNFGAEQKLVRSWPGVRVVP